MTTRVRLLKVAVQPVFVLDDGEHLREKPGAVVEVPGGSWRDFATTSFGASDLAAVQAEYDASQSGDGDGGE